MLATGFGSFISLGRCALWLMVAPVLPRPNFGAPHPGGTAVNPTESSVRPDPNRLSFADLDQLVQRLKDNPSFPIHGAALEWLIPALWKAAEVIAGRGKNRALAPDVFADALVRLSEPGALDRYDPGCEKPIEAYAFVIGKNRMRESAAQLKGAAPIPKTPRRRIQEAKDNLEGIHAEPVKLRNGGVRRFPMTVTRWQWEQNGGQMAPQRTVADVTGKGSKLDRSTLLNALGTLEAAGQLPEDDRFRRESDEGSGFGDLNSVVEAAADLAVEREAEAAVKVARGAKPRVIGTPWPKGQGKCEPWKKALIAEALIHLKPVEQKALCHWYGLNAHEEAHTFEDLGLMLHCATSTAHDRVRRAQKKAEAVIEQHPDARHLRRDDPAAKNPNTGS
jgi:hypothetical protein